MIAPRYHHLIAFLITLTASLAAKAQEAGKDSLEATFSRYQSRTPQEKLFAHIDRSFYLAGETIWFKLYDIDARTNRPLTFSSIAYIEVLDNDDHPVLQTKVELKDGKGDGSFSIPLSIPSGQFLFRAYTNWMRNFPPDFYYMQSLTILNTLRDTVSETRPASDTPSAGIRLFPEGGNLVNGLASLVAAQTTDRHGKGVPCEGVITDQNKDTVTRFHTGPTGIGKFSFIPAKGHSYFALTEIDHRTISQSLPTVYDQGYVIHAEAENSNRIHITVHAAGPAESPFIYLLVHTRGQMKAAQVNALSDGQTSFYLDKDSLSEGISHITVFNSDRIPVCERLWFKQPAEQLHIRVTTGPGAHGASADAAPSYPTRSPVSIGLSATDKAGNPMAADLSMSVFRLDSLQPLPTGNILTWLLLSSELKGGIDIPLANDSDSAAADELDGLMLTRGWSRFRWEDILKTDKPVFEFLPEANGPIVSARVIDKRTGQPPTPVIGYLSVPGQHFKLATALSQTDGNLYFNLDNFYGARTLIAQTNPRTDSNCRIEIPSPWSDRFASFPLPQVHYSLSWSNQLLQRTIDAQAENAYLTARKHQFSPSPEDTVAFYGTADLRYNLDDYVRFVTMEEVIQEFVENVHIRRKTGHAYFRVRNTLFNLFFDDDPLLLIDGIPVFNPDKVVATDPGRIQKIDVVSHKYILGPSVTDGVISLISYDGEFAGYELDPNALAMQYNGLDQHREFYTPVYDAGNKGMPSIPDFRNELLWKPNILVDATGKQTLPLYTSDLTGKFALVVQGITKDGLAGYSIETFSVGQ
jgi:hypothetical protein